MNGRWGSAVPAMMWSGSGAQPVVRTKCEVHCSGVSACGRSCMWGRHAASQAHLVQCEPLVELLPAALLAQLLLADASDLQGPVLHLATHGRRNLRQKSMFLVLVCMLDRTTTHS